MEKEVRIVKDSFKILFCLSLIVLQGCLYSDKPLPNREAVSTTSPLIGYWKALPKADDTETILISVSYIGSPDYLFVISTAEEINKTDESANEEADEEEIEIYEAYLTRYEGRTYVSLREKRNTGAIRYEIYKYGLIGDKMLSVQALNWEKLNEVIKSANFSAEQYNTDNGTLTMDSKSLMEFVASLKDDLFNSPVLFEKITPRQPKEDNNTKDANEASPDKV